MAVEFGQAPPFGRSDLHPRHVANLDRCSVLALENDLLDVLGSVQIAAPAHHVFALGHFDGAATDIRVAGTNRVDDFAERNAVSTQLFGIDHDLVLLDEAADAGNFGNARHLGELVADEPVLNRAQLRESPLCPDDGILEHPAYAGRVGPQGWRHASRKLVLGEAEIFQHPATRPVDVGAVIEDDINKGHAEHGEAAHNFCFGHRQKRGGQWIGHLVLDHLRRLARIFGIDNDLRIGEVRDGVQGRCEHGPYARADDEECRQKNQHPVARGPCDDASNHGLSPDKDVLDVLAFPAVKACSAACRLLSASIRKLALTTTCSPAFSPSSTWV